MNKTAALKHQYDVTVIGGGIHGAGIAQAAAAAGYKVLLLEKTAWAAGTSSKSSKLIHGGLRYLQSGQFGLVRESIREREILLKIAPELVRRNNFYIPLYKDSHYQSWQLRIALSLYALLGLNREVCRFSRLTDQQSQQLPDLKKTGLQQVFRYCDAQTDDSLLTRAVIESAQSLGAQTLVPVTLQSATHVGGGYALQYQWQNQQHETISRVVINATGPWANQVNHLVSPSVPTIAVDLIQGTHLILAGKISDECFYLEAPQDQRAVFVLPWYGNTLLGTTETLFTGDPNKVEPLQSEKDYLLAVLKHYFPKIDAQVIDAFAGLRVLPKQNTNAFSRSRETHLICDRRRSPQWISVYGGKLTGYRATASKVVTLIAKSIGPRNKIADTRTLPLTLTRDESHSDPIQQDQNPSIRSMPQPNACALPVANSQNVD